MSNALQHRPSAPGSPCRAGLNLAAWSVIVAALFLAVPRLPAVTLWSDPNPTVAFDTDTGRELLQGALKRDDSSRDTLYFKLRVTPRSDATTEDYLAGFEFFEGEHERFGIGNALKAHAYTAFYRAGSGGGGGAADYVDLRSSTPEPPQAGNTPIYELPRRGVERTIVFKVQYVPGGEDLVTVWLNPDLSAGATEVHQPESLTTRLNANVSFDEIRLRHSGRGEGWLFSDLAIATSFEDFVDPSSGVSRADAGREFFDRQRHQAVTWLREPGMPQAAISALAQTADGYLWLAGEDRLARFDGVRFTAFDMRTITGVGTIQVLFGDARGALWVGMKESGLARYAQGKFETFTTTQGLPANQITALAGDRAGTLWVGTTAGLVAGRAGVFKRVEALAALDGRIIRTLFVDAAGTLWIGAAQAGVFQFAQGKLTKVGAVRLENVLNDPQSLGVDARGRLWLAAGDDLVLCRDGAEWSRYRIPRQSSASKVRTLAVNGDGAVWIGSAGEGLFQVNENKLTAMNATTGLADNQIGALLMDRDGQLWLGGGAGLHLLKRRHWFKVGQAEGLGPGAVSGLAEVLPGAIWAAQPERGLFRWEGGTFRRLPAAGLPPNDSTVGAMLTTRDGCWVACTNGLLLFRDPQAVAEQSLLFPLSAGDGITALAEETDSSVLVGTRDGELWRLMRGTWERVARLAARVPISGVAADATGNIWLGTYGAGLWQATSNAAPQRLAVLGAPGEFIRALLRDADGTLWVGTDGGGLIAVRGGSATVFTREQGLPEERILGLLEDAAGHLWLQDEGGLTCLQKPRPGGVRVAVLGIYPVAATVLQKATPGAEGAALFGRSFRSNSGQLWFATSTGALVVEPPAFATNPVVPALIIESVLVDGAKLETFLPVSNAGDTSAAAPPPAGVRLKQGRHSLEIQFTSPQPATGNARLRFRLVGLDADWVEAGAARVAQYRYVPPGEYEFTVEATDPKAKSRKVTLALTVEPHLWQRGWVVGTVLVGLLALIAGGARFIENRRMKVRVRRLEQENALERERTRIAQDLHDEMGAKLCRISFLTEHVSRLDPASGEAKQQIATIADDSRKLLHSLDEIVWVVNPKNDTLEHAASYIGQYASDYFHGTGVECEVDVAAEIPHLPVSSQTRHHLFLAVHEALTNALKHSGATQVRLAIRWDGAALHISVDDNGRGFDLAAPSGRVAKDGESGNGLPNMQQRMTAIGGRCTLESAPGGGTRIRFVLDFSQTPSQGVKS